jgi:hypothetical protein
MAGNFVAGVLIAEGGFCCIGTNLFFIHDLVYAKSLAGTAFFFFIGTFFTAKAMHYSHGKNYKGKQHKRSHCFFHDQSFNSFKKFVMNQNSIMQDHLLLPFGVILGVYPQSGISL